MRMIRSILATLYLFLYPGTWKEIREGIKSPIADCLPFKDVKW